jgi:hypothetical protein
MVGVARRNAECKEEMLKLAGKVLAGAAHRSRPARAPLPFGMGRCDHS